MLVRDGSIAVETPTGAMRTYVYEPAQPGRPEDRVPGVVLYSEIFQQTPPMRRLAVQIAGHGYLVMVPEVYHSRLPPGTVLGYDDEGKTRGDELKAEIELATFDRDTDAVLRALAEHPRSRGLEQTLELPSSQSEDGDLGSGKTSVHENQGEDVDSSNF